MKCESTVARIALSLAIALPAVARRADAEIAGSKWAPLRGHIGRAWDDLTRSNRGLRDAAIDPKLGLPSGARWPVYVSRREDRARVARELEGLVGAEGWARIDLRRLPRDPKRMQEHGLLYLPHPYVVPGGRFNEMYGWAVLNANRTYYLTRSQPPFLTRMVLMLHDARPDREYLRRIGPALEDYYRYWTREPHTVAQTGLSRYFDVGDGPAPEVVQGERDEKGRSHYDRVREYYREHDVDAYDERRFYDPGRDRLTPLFYKGDRTMRESGFDPSDRFGPFGVGALDFAPVCLNSLLYQMELDMARVQAALGRVKKAEAFRARAERRRAAVDRYLWDEDAGVYFDYNFETGRRRPYIFATTFYPLWVGLASPAQAARVRDNLRKLEAPGGLLTSTNTSGSQWDAPFGWAPLQWIAVQGLRRYGFDEDADRLANKFLALVLKEYEEHGVIVEKYDAVRRESDVAAGIRFGYSSNEVGFGWTNGVVLDLLATLDRREP
jgi:alpha,alpha-trehalase